ncbi:MAG TPA: hypothetical protein VFQ89_00555 [Candidatus Binatia bacterium]|nr:hypothetical protein [Candidatus Binatia bacterium]
MKVREVYSSYALIAGLVCLVFGVGNWVVGAVETAKYQNLLLKTAHTGLEDSYRNFQQLDQQRNEEVLRRLTENREKYNAARVKLNFFYVVLTGGRLMFLVGALITVVALVRMIRRDAQSKIQRLEIQGRSTP